MTELWQQAGGWLALGVAALLCLAGVGVSVLSLSGAWLVAGAAALLTVARADGAPGWWVVGGLLAVSGLLEVVEAFAGKIGVARRGGSAAAGWAALGGGLAGMVVGGLLPLPLFGSLFGMLAGSFLCAYAVEKRRLRAAAPAARIARGAVWARLAVMFLKTVAALGMSGVLWYLVLV